MSEVKVDPKKILVEELKKHGLDIAEDAVKGIVEAVFDSLPKFVLATENKYDDLLIAILPVAKESVLKLVDKIDGEDD